MYNKLQKD